MSSPEVPQKWAPKTSLEILNPPSTRNVATETTDSGQGQELMDLSRLCIDDINQRKIYTTSTVPAFIAPDFKADNSGHPVRNTYWEFTQFHRDIALVDPDYHVRVANTSVDMDERSGHASVYMLVEICGRPKDTRRGAVIVWRWRKRFGTWLLYRQVGIRGMCGVLEDGRV